MTQYQDQNQKQGQNQNNLVPDNTVVQSQQQPVSGGTGGPEGQPASIEQQGSHGVEAKEVLKQIESTAERQAEELVKKEQKVQKQAIQKQKALEKKNKPRSEGPKVYGYKLPVQITENLKKVSSMKGKGNPKTGIACLYVFVDRLLRMHSR